MDLNEQLQDLIQRGEPVTPEALAQLLSEGNGSVNGSAGNANGSSNGGGPVPLDLGPDESVVAESAADDPTETDQEKDDRLQAAISKDIAASIYDTDLLGELAGIPEFRFDMIATRVIAGVTRGVGDARQQIRSLKVAVATHRTQTATAAGNGGGQLPTDRPWRVVTNYGENHGTWERKGAADNYWMDKVLDEAIELVSILVVDGIEKALEVNMIPSTRGRVRSVVVPLSVITSSSPSEAMRVESQGKLVWIPEEGRVVQGYLGFLYRNHGDELRRKAYERPGWYDGVLHIPGAEYPEGVGMKFIGDERVSHYGHHCYEDENDAVASMLGVYNAALEHEKFGVMLGGCVCSPFLEYVGRRGFVVHPTGVSTKGKTQSGKCAISVWGCPKELEGDWNTTSVGASKLITTYGCVPPFFDDTGSGGRNIEQVIKDVVFRVASGHSRTAATQSGGLREEDPDAWLVLLSTGERSLTSASHETGLKVRTVELPAPIFPTAVAADHTAALAEDSHGWVAQQIVDMGSDALDLFSRLLEAIEPRLKDSVTGGIEKRLAGQFALCGAGLALVGVLLGYDESEAVEDALEVCVRALGVSVKSIKSEGTTITDKVARLLVDLTVSHSAYWVVRGEPAYSGDENGEARFKIKTDNNGDPVLREWWGAIEKDNTKLYVFPHQFKHICKQFLDIDDPQPVLVDFMEQGVLEGGDEEHLSKLVRMVDPQTGVKKPIRVYCLNMAKLDPDAHAEITKNDLSKPERENMKKLLRGLFGYPRVNPVTPNGPPPNLEAVLKEDEKPE